MTARGKQPRARQVAPAPQRPPPAPKLPPEPVERVECPKCGCHHATKVRSDPVFNRWLRQRYECRFCRWRFTVLEVVKP
jgi:hypothetical protein